MLGRSKLNIPERKLILVAGDVIIIISLLYFFLRHVIDNNTLSVYANILLFGIGFLAYFFLAYVLNFYYLGITSNYSGRTIIKGFLISLLFVLGEVLLSVIIFDISFWRINLLLFLFGTPLLLFFWRKLFFYVFKFISTTKDVLYFYNKRGHNLEKDVSIINGHEINTFYNVIESIDLGEAAGLTEKELKELDTNIDSWIIDTDTSKPLPKNVEKTMLDAFVEGKEIVTFSSFYENIYEALPIISHNANESCSEILQLQHTRIRYLYRVFSFTVNFLLGLFIGVIFATVTPFVFLLNLLLNRGPLFYVQQRIGQYGKEFNIYKFRSMVVDAEKSGAKMASKNDARITPFGKILRMFRVDELPQILSVIRGDMLFIGPRPEREVFVDKLNTMLPYYNIRHLVKPGITGWAQVKYKYGETLDDSIQKLEYDLYYIKSRSITLDLRIIFKTFTTIIFSRGV